MILGHDEFEIVKIASEYQSELTDGVVQYNYETGELCGAGFTTGTVENPTNKVIEVLRLPQGEDGEFDCKCHENGDCPFWIEDENCFDDFMKDEYGDDRITCCINGSLETWNLEEDIQEELERQIRDVLNDHLGDTISKLNEIRIAISDKFGSSYDYFNVRQDDWEMRTLDCHVDSAIEYGFNTSVSPRDYLDGDIEEICLRYEEDNEFVDVVCLLRDGDFNGALELLQNG